MKIKAQEEFNEFIDEIIDGLQPAEKVTAFLQKEEKDLRGLCSSIFIDVAFSEKCFSDPKGDLLMYKEKDDHYPVTEFGIVKRYKNIVVHDFVVYVYEDKFEFVDIPRDVNSKDLLYFFKYMENYLGLEEQ